ncbi:nitrite transporter [Klebsiella grimontii]|uniref:nitrite transporter n=2 Tax=Klebsiella grimontii TaxID=2058152 RepID=UPI002929927A|nr:nitrite transporter [Klebsiella grimontii]MDV0336625.1 nitrite transporter [Klebsiella grimontii]MDV0380069.1 nitrite transporter [Klebsiella grimontii]MDV0390764.1 nitrite transporter [Klebsiella grimontii]MDV0411821.1 nitrite transporter [Klebsiella grimontii]
MFNADKYRSVTWLKGGRVYPQLDCFGIVNEIRRDLKLPLWPDFAGVTKDGGGLDREARRLMLSLQRCEPCEGAGVACYSGSTVTHVGIVVMLDNQLQVAECNPGSGVTFVSVVSAPSGRS